MTPTDVDSSGADNVSGQQQKPVEGEVQDVAQLVSTLSDAVKRIQSEVSGIYSRQDKQANVLEKLAKAVKERPEGQTIDQAVAQAEALIRREARDQALEEAILKIASGNLAAPQAQVPETPQAAKPIDATLSKVLQALGRDPNAPEIVAIVDKMGGDMAKVVAEVQKLQASQNPSPALSPAPAGTAPATTVYNEDVYQKELKAIIDSTRPGDERIKQITKLKIEARKKGLEKF